MKPAAPRRSVTRIIGCFFILISIGCASGSAPAGDDRVDAPPPPRVKQPPPPKTGTSTAPGCDGVPESGRCEDGVAVFCDLAAGELRRKDCKALGKSCLVDTARGAVCETVMPGDGPTTCDTGVTFEGSCNGQTAVWCDPATNQTIAWDCDGDGLACTVDDCGFGAYCCSSSPSPSPVNECPALGFAGECEGNTARWCNGDQLIEKACGSEQSCQLDACAEGAFCCDPPEDPPQSECDQLGVRGICTADGNVRWCNGGVVDEVSCLAGHTCQIDACGDGASCCAP